MAVPNDEMKRPVIRVGEGRGFLARATDEADALIITAAHCLPSFPPCASFSVLEERTYESLVRLLGAEPAVWAECRFVDPIADIAVLGPPDPQELPDERDRYGTLLEEIQPFLVSEAPLGGRAWLLSLDGRWLVCKIERISPSGSLWISEAEKIEGGMSGSPVIADDGSAIGVVCTGATCQSAGSDVCTEGGPNPVLTLNLPGWFWR
jgi:hypothetical protein